MAYATPQDLQDAAGGAARFLQLTDQGNDGTSDSGPVASAQAAAEGFVNAYLGRYALPLVSPTPEIRRIAAEETIYRLKVTLGAATDMDMDLRKERERQLLAYQHGTMRPDLEGVLRSTGRARIVTSEDAESPVSRSSLKGMW